MLVNYGNIHNIFPLGQFGYGSGIGKRVRERLTYSPAKNKWHRDRDVPIMQYKA